MFLRCRWEISNISIYVINYRLYTNTNWRIIGLTFGLRCRASVRISLRLFTINIRPICRLIMHYQISDLQRILLITRSKTMTAPCKYHRTMRAVYRHDRQANKYILPMIFVCLYNVHTKYPFISVRPHLDFSPRYSTNKHIALTIRRNWTVAKHILHAQ